MPTASGAAGRARGPSGQRRMVQVYLTPGLADEVRQIQVGVGMSNAELVLTAIQATHQQLEGIIAAESAIPDGGLFSREYRPRRDAGGAEGACKVDEGGGFGGDGHVCWRWGVGGHGRGRDAK